MSIRCRKVLTMNQGPAFREAFPILYVDDVARAIAFYTRTLGFDIAFTWPGDDEPTTFAFLRLEPLGIGIAQRSPHQHGRDSELCIYTDDADGAGIRLRDAGAEELQPPQDEPWGERRAYFRDLDGHVIHIAQTL